jgi:Membrane-associating domain
VGVEFLTMLFFFAGFIAVAADIGDVSCDLFDDDAFFGSGNLKTGCQCTKAAIAFGAFSWY